MTFGGVGTQYIEAVAYDPISGITVAGGYASIAGKGFDALIATIAPNGQVKMGTTGGTSTEYIRAVAIFPGGMIAAAGASASQPTKGGYDGYFVTTDLSLTKFTEKKFGGTSTDYFYGMTTSTKNTAVVVGYTYVSGKSYVGWAMELDPVTGMKSGFEQHYGGTKSDYLYGIGKSGSGGYLLAGRGSSYTVNWDTWQLGVAANGAETCK